MEKPIVFYHSGRILWDLIGISLGTWYAIEIPHYRDIFVSWKKIRRIIFKALYMAPDHPPLSFLPISLFLLC
jgi:hypothetical protein